MHYAKSATREIRDFLRGRQGESWCTDCLERALGRRLHAAPAQLEGYPGFRRSNAPCFVCGKVRLILMYVPEMTPAELRRLTETALQARTLPDDPQTPATTVTGLTDTACTLCRRPLGSAPAFELRDGNGIVLLHASCFGVWVEVVVTPKPNGA